MRHTKAHEVLIKNAKRAVENLSKDNSVSLSKVHESLADVMDYLEDLMWAVEDELEAEWAIEKDEEIKRQRTVKEDQ